MDVFNSYLTNDERIFAIEEAETAMIFHKMDVLMESINADLQIMREEAELKVLREGGTYDDLEYLYEEANAEAGKKKEGVIHAIIEAIKSIWAAVKSKFTKTVEEAPEEIEVPADLDAKSNVFQKVWKEIKGFFGNLKKGVIDMNIADKIKEHIKPIVGVGAALTATGVATIKIPKTKLSDICNKLKNVGDEATNMSASLENDQEPSPSGDANATDSNGKPLKERFHDWYITAKSALANAVKTFVTEIQKVSNFISAKIHRKSGDDNVVDGEAREIPPEKDNKDDQKSDGDGQGNDAGQGQNNDSGNTGGNPVPADDTSGQQVQRDTGSGNQGQNASGSNQNSSGSGQNQQGNNQNTNGNGSQQASGDVTKTPSGVEIKGNTLNYLKQNGITVTKSAKGAKSDEWKLLSNGAYARLNPQGRVTYVAKQPPASVEFEGYITMDSDPVFYESAIQMPDGTVVYSKPIDPETLMESTTEEVDNISDLLSQL